MLCSTSSPAGVRALGERLRDETGDAVRLVDAPVSGGVEGATAATLSIMLGGSDPDAERAADVLRACGRPVHLGPLGAGEVAKACNQLVVGTTTAALAEAAELAERSGLDPAALFDVLSGGLAGSRVLDVVGPRLVSKDYTPTGPAKFMHKDLSFVLDAARAAGTAAPIATAAVELYTAEPKAQHFRTGRRTTHDF